MRNDFGCCSFCLTCSLQMCKTHHCRTRAGFEKQLPGLIRLFSLVSSRAGPSLDCKEGALCVSSALRTEFHGLCQCQTCEIQFFSWDISVVVDRGEQTLKNFLCLSWNLEEWRQKGQVSGLGGRRGGGCSLEGTLLIGRSLKLQAGLYYSVNNLRTVHLPMNAATVCLHLVIIYDDSGTLLHAILAGTGDCWRKSL